MSTHICYWGADSKGIFDLVNPSRAQTITNRIHVLCPKSAIRNVAVGHRVISFTRCNGRVSVYRPQGEGKANAWKLKHLDLKKNKIKELSCGVDHVVLLAFGGRVFFMDKSTPPRPLSNLSELQVSQVACGDQHSMALTQVGQLFTWGQNSWGQLGLGKSKPSSPHPQRLMCLGGIPLSQISAGGGHSFALSLSGAVFSWGRNNAGQLGLGDRADRYVPVNVTALTQKKTAFIACGDEHTATLAKGGVMLTFGSSKYGQLGHNSFKDELHPRIVSALFNWKVSQIACGSQHTLAFVGSSNTIYSFGYGEQGQLGNGQRTSQSVPTPISLSSEQIASQTVERIVAGGNHSFALCSVKESERDSTETMSFLRQGILTLNQRMIDRWMAECDSNSWREIQRGIKKIFSSAACLNGSFLQESSDKHFQTSAECHGLEFSLVQCAFEKLAEKDKVLAKVEKEVGHWLLPSLHCSSTGVEELRVYLILPELLRILHRQQRGKDLTISVATAILKLKPDSRQVLANYWLTLPACSFKTLVEVFRSVSEELLHETVLYRKTRWQDTVQVLQMIFEANTRPEIDPRDFHINEVNEIFLSLFTLDLDLQELYWVENVVQIIEEKTFYEKQLKHLLLYPCIFNLEAKCALLKHNRKHRFPFILTLRRTALLEDAWSQLRAVTEHELKGVLMVRYQEDLKDSDVNKRDFFHKLFKEFQATDSGMFMYNDTNTLVWFPTQLNLDTQQSRLQEESYFLLGILCGLAFYNNSVVHMPFPLALFKKLVNVKPSLEDLAEFSPVVVRCLQDLLDKTDDDVAETMMMSFLINWDGIDVELDPREPGKAVTQSNKKEFVDAYVDYTLNKSVERVFEEFRRGFYKVCDRDMVELFQPEELRGVMVGQEEYDWETFRQNVQYEGQYHARHPTIITFWEVFDELSHEEKKSFLLFLTGYERAPVLGMGHVKMRVQDLFNSTPDHLPEALTCHSLLMLPMYRSKQSLRVKLKEALDHKRGFWDQ